MNIFEGIGKTYRIRPQISRLNSLTTEDFKEFWRGRPLVRPLTWINCPVYQFNSTTANWVPRPK